MVSSRRTGVAPRAVGCLVASLATMLAMNGCELANTVIPRADPELVIYAILDPSAQTQVVLVEQSLTGQAIDTTVARDRAVKGAVVKLTGPDGTVMMGSEQWISPGVRLKDATPQQIRAWRRAARPKVRNVRTPARTTRRTDR